MKAEHPQSITSALEFLSIHDDRESDISFTALMPTPLVAEFLLFDPNHQAEVM